MKKNLVSVVVISCVSLLAVSLFFSAFGRETARSGSNAIGEEGQKVKATGTYMRCTDGSDMIIFENEPCCVSNKTGRNDVFNNLNTGDRVSVVCSPILETYPGKTTVYEIELLERGSIEDINQNMLESLAELGWKPASTK